MRGPQRRKPTCRTQEEKTGPPLQARTLNSPIPQPTCPGPALPRRSIPQPTCPGPALISPASFSSVSLFLALGHALAPGEPLGRGSGSARPKAGQSSVQRPHSHVASVDGQPQARTRPGSCQLRPGHANRQPSLGTPHGETLQVSTTEAHKHSHT